MGCLNQRGANSEEGFFISSLREVIEAGDLQALEKRINLYKMSLDVSSLNSPLFHQKSLKLSALSLALYSGNLESFRYLLEKLNLSHIEMEKNLISNNTSSFHILCEKNYTDLLEYYIPIYLGTSSTPSSPPNSSLQYELIQNKTFQSQTIKSKSPIQIACELGHISTLITIQKSLSSIKDIPYFLNIHQIDETSGENCVFIACRKTNHLMLRCLYEVVQADFSLKNFNGEDCLTVLIDMWMDKGTVGFIESLVYLIEVVRVVVDESCLDKLKNAKDSRVLEVFNRNLAGIRLTGVRLTFEVEGVEFREDRDDREEDLKWQFSLDFDTGKDLRNGICFGDSDQTGLSSISPIDGIYESNGFIEL